MTVGASRSWCENLAGWHIWEDCGTLLGARWTQDIFLPQGNGGVASSEKESTASFLCTTELPFGAVTPRRKQAADQSDACARWSETVPFRWERWAPARGIGAASPTSNCRVMFPSPDNGSPSECLGSLYFKDEHLWVLKKIPVCLLKPRRLYKSLADRYHNRAPPISLLLSNNLSPPISPFHHQRIHARAGSQWELMIWQLELRIPIELKC